MATTEKDAKPTGMLRFATWLPFLAAFILMFLYAYNTEKVGFHGDALETWRVARNWWDPDNTFRSYVEYRGFLFFFINALIFKISTVFDFDQYLTLRFFTSLLFAAMAAISLPNLVGQLVGKSPTWLQRAVCVVIVFYFFRGHFLYPSTDAISLWFAVLALNAILRNERLTYQQAALSSLWIGCAILCRGNFILSVLPLALIALHRWSIGFEIPNKKSVLRILVFAAPLSLLLAFNSWYAVERDILHGPTPLKGSKVLIGQLTLGMKYQRVEWRTGGPYPHQPIWIEPTGRKILESRAVQTDWVQPKEYVQLVATHPIQFAQLYLRHLFNGLDIAYPTVYVPDVTQRSWIFSILNYLLLFWGLSLVLTSVRQKDGRLINASTYAVLFLPALACIPFQVEPRFFISLGLPLLIWPVIAGRLQDIKPLWVLAALVFVGLCFALSHHVFLNLEGTEVLPFHTLP